jgi:PAS domain S-box-containing protein
MSDIARKKPREVALEQREGLLHAITQCAAQLVSATSVDAVIPGALETIGKALQADRVLVIETIHSEAPARPVALAFIWQSPDIPVKIDAEFFLDPVVTSPEIGVWLRPLAEGKVLFASVGDAPGAVDRLLSAIQTKSILFVPIQVEGKWWGTVSVDDCKLNRKWSSAETDILKTFATMVGASITRERLWTEVQRTKTALLESERKFHGAFEQTFALMGLLAIDGTVLEANRTAMEVTGDSTPDIIGKPFWETPWWSRSPELQGRLRDAIARAANGDLVRLEASNSAPDGSILYVDVSITPMRDETGKIVSLIVEGRDITALKRTEVALRESEEGLRRAIDTARDAIVTLDGEKGVVTAWNPAAEAIFGYSREEMIGQPLHETLTPPRFHEASRKGMAHFATTGEGAVVGKTLELVALHKNGTEFPIELSLSAMQGKGKWSAIGIVRDITVRQSALRALKTIRAGNEVLVRAVVVEKLLDQMCRTLVEVGGYRMAWIGMKEHDEGQTVRPVAWAGYDAGYVEEAKLSWADTGRECGAGTAVRTGVPQICQNLTRFLPEAAEALARGYMSTAAFPLKDGAETFGVLTIYAAQTDAFTEAEVALLVELSDDLAYGICALRIRTEREVTLQRLQNSLATTVEALASMAEQRDRYTAGHQRRVAQLAAAIAGEMGLGKDRIEGLFLAGVIHDIGKNGVPADILSKPDKLTAIEFELVKTHAQLGYDIVKAIDFPWPVGLMILQHHERLDGSGYPNGLKGEEILLEAKILGVADVVEAMMSHRPYRPAIGLDAALAEVENGKGRLYDPAAVEACLTLFRKKEFKFS